MLVNRLQEEERILVQEMKRHWGGLQRAAGTLEALSQQLQDQSNVVELSEGGSNGLLCHLKRRLSELTQDQVNTRNTYHKLILGEGDIFDDSDVDENSDEDKVILLRAQMTTAMLSEIIHHPCLFLSVLLSPAGEVKDCHHLPWEQSGLLMLTPDPSPSEPIQGNVICLMTR